MFNLKKLFFFLSVLLVIHPFLFAEEQITITTYYPSPAGSYYNLYVLNRLGIGTTSPGYKLEIAALSGSVEPTSLKLSGGATNGIQIRIGDNYSGSVGTRYSGADTFIASNSYQSTLGVDSWTKGVGTYGSTMELLGISSSLTASAFQIMYSPASTATGSLSSFFTSTLFTILGNGNVGIGTTAPAIAYGNKILTIGNANYPELEFYAFSPGNGGRLGNINFTNGVSSTGGAAAITGDLDSGVTTDAFLSFCTGHGLTGGILPPERMRITSGGLVGIGTTGPSNLLHIMGNNDNNGNYYSQIRVDGTGAYPLNIAGISLNPSGAGIQSHIRFLENGTPKVQIRFNNGSTTDNKLKIYSWTTGTDFVTFDAGSGNVGIGTTVPGANLDVWAANPVLRVSTSYASSPYTAAIDLGYQASATSKLRVAYKADTAETFIDNVYQPTVSGQPYGDINLRIYPSGGNAPVPGIIIKGYTSYVGIGSTSPTSKFVVKSAGAGYNAGLFLGGTTCFSILPHNGVVYLSAGTNYEASVWNYTYHSGLGASLLAINETTGVNWYSGTGDSYSNVASNVQLWTAAGVWVGSSSRKLKENFTQLNPDDILQKIDQLDVSRWNFKSEGKPITHIGPVAEDFYRIFKTGDSEEKLATIDSVGVSLAGVKALSQKIKTQQQQIEKLQQEIEGLKSGFQGLKSKL